jgi:DNA-binding response OmpR family regulator
MSQADSLSKVDRAVLDVLTARRGKVVSRATIAREAGLGHLHSRRPDASIAAIREVLGVDSVVTVRGRGWILAE